MLEREHPAESGQPDTLKRPDEPERSSEVVVSIGERAADLSVVALCALTRGDPP